MASLEIVNLRKSFGAAEVLKGIDLQVEDGELVVLVGPSGCGKSTLLAIIAGLESVTDGEVVIGERVVNHVHPKDRNIAMVFQSYALYPTMTARQNITFGMECRSVPRHDQDAALTRVAQLLQIEPLLGRKPSQLSGGQRQRVAMGRALVRDPELFLFDEPLSNLDAKLRVEMRTEIKKLHHRLGTTIVYVTHDQVEAMTLASRIAVMHQGSIQQFAEPRETYERPANMFVAGFMGSPPMNFIPARLAAGGNRPEVVIDNEGTTLRLPVPHADEPLQAWRERELILGIRPENIAHHGRRAHDQAGAVGELEAEVLVVEPTGAETMVVIRLGGREVIARVDPDEAQPEGSLMHFQVDMRKACLFDPASEKLI